MANKKHAKKINAKNRAAKNAKTSKKTVKKVAAKFKAKKSTVSKPTKKHATKPIQKGSISKAKTTGRTKKQASAASRKKPSKSSKAKKVTIYVPSSIKVGRKTYKGKITEVVAKAAKFKGMKVKDYIKKYREEIENMANLTYDREKKNVDRLIDLVNNSKGKKVFIDSGNGKKRYTKPEAIKELAMLQQFIKSNSKVAYFELDRDIYLSGDIVFNMPESDEYLDFSSDNFGDYDSMEDYLEEYEIDYVIS